MSDAAPPPEVDPSLSQPGEPVFAVQHMEIAPSVNMVAIQVQSNNGIMCQVVIRPDLAITLAGLIHEHAKQAKSGIVIAQAIPPNGKPHA